MNTLVGDVKANPRYFYRNINSQKKRVISVLKNGMEGDGVARSDSERSEELIDQFNDTFNKTEYKEVPLARRLAPFHG